MCLAGISLSESLVDKNSQLVVMTFTGVFLPITWWLFSVAYLLCNLYHNELTDTKNDLIMTPSHGCIINYWHTCMPIDFASVVISVSGGNLPDLTFLIGHIAVLSCHATRPKCYRQFHMLHS